MSEILYEIEVANINTKIIKKEFFFNLEDFLIILEIISAISICIKVMDVPKYLNCVSE